MIDNSSMSERSISDHSQPVQAPVTTGRRRKTYNGLGVQRTRQNIWQPPMAISQLSRMAAVDYNYLYLILKGERKPSTRTARRLAVALNMDTYELLRLLNW